MEFTGDIGLWQRRIAESTEGMARRLAVMETLQPEAGWRVLDAGCGSGHLVSEMARAVGHTGRALGIDFSADQVEAARVLTEGIANAEIIQGDVCAIPSEDATFDCISSIQTLEYVPEIDRALQEIRRVLRPKGRVAFVSVLWDTFRYHGPEPVLNNRMIEAWRAHCPHQMLPVEIPARMNASGLEGVFQRPLTFFNTSYHENSLPFTAAKVIASFAQSQGVSEEDTRMWLDQLDQAEREGRFGFVSVPVITAGVAA